MSISARIAKGSLWISGARAIVNALGFLSTLVLARLLTPADFGVVAIATTLLAIIQSVTNLSLAEALIQHPDPQRRHFDSVWTLSVLRGLILGGLFAAAGPFTAHFFNEPRLTVVMAILGGGVMLTGAANPRQIMYQKDLIFWQDFMLKVAEKIAAVLVTCTIAFIYRSYWALVLGSVAGQVTSTLTSYLVLPYRPKPGVRDARALFRFSAWLTLSQAMNTINWRFDQLLIGKFVGRQDLGFYSVGSNLAVLPTRETTAPLTQALYPGFAQVSGKPERLRAAYQKAQSLVTAIALPLGVGMALMAKPLVVLAIGQEWLGVIFVIQALASVFAFQTLGSLVQPLGMAVGHTRRLFTRDVTMFFIRVPIIVAGVVLGGLRGIVIARVIGGLIIIGFNMVMVREFTGLMVREQLKANVRALVGVGVMAAGVIGLREIVPDPPSTTRMIALALFEIAFGGVLYIGTTYAQWAAVGRPGGAEREILAIASRLLEKRNPFRARTVRG